MFSHQFVAKRTPDNTPDMDRNAYEPHQGTPTRRVEVFFTFHCYGEKFEINTVLDLEYGERALEQVKGAFVEVYPMKLKRNEVVELFTERASYPVKSTAQLFKHIKDPLNWAVMKHPYINLEGSTRQVQYAMDDPIFTPTNNLHVEDEKRLRFLRDTRIAEDQLELRELITKQEERMGELEKTVEKLGALIALAEIKDNGEDHNAMCDGCEVMVRGHRFKCAVCPDFDLCAKCEVLGKHTEHVMLRIPLAKDTLIPDYIAKEIAFEKIEKPTEELPEPTTPNPIDTLSKEETYQRLLNFYDSFDQYYQRESRYPPVKPSKEESMAKAKLLTELEAAGELTPEKTFEILAGEDVNKKKTVKCDCGQHEESEESESDSDDSDDSSDLSGFSEIEDLELLEQEDGMKTALEPEEEEELHTAVAPTPEPVPAEAKWEHHDQW